MLSAYLQSLPGLNSPSDNSACPSSLTQTLRAVRLSTCLCSEEATSMCSRVVQNQQNYHSQCQAAEKPHQGMKKKCVFPSRSQRQRGASVTSGQGCFLGRGTSLVLDKYSNVETFLSTKYNDVETFLSAGTA